MPIWVRFFSLSFFIFFYFFSFSLCQRLKINKKKEKWNLGCQREKVFFSLRHLKSNWSGKKQRNEKTKCPFGRLFFCSFSFIPNSSSKKVFLFSFSKKEKRRTQLLEKGVVCLLTFCNGVFFVRFEIWFSLLLCLCLWKGNEQLLFKMNEETSLIGSNISIPKRFPSWKNSLTFTW